MPRVLQAFTDEQYVIAHNLLASKVASMMGRKFEEGDWADVYCKAKSIPNTSWSNLNIDVAYKGLGVEHKMLCMKKKKVIREHCGTTLMHPSATRSIRIPDMDDATECAKDVLGQYAELISQRREKVRENAPSGSEPDMRTGWLLWQDSLRQFLYFEEEMVEPNPEDYYSVWRESGGGARKRSRNLWVYDKETERKRYSITTSAGAKIQPYFDVPSPEEEYLYVFIVQGEQLVDGRIRVWITRTTSMLLESLIGSLDEEAIGDAIMTAIPDSEDVDAKGDWKKDIAVPVELSEGVYQTLCEKFPGISDEHMFQCLATYLAG